MRRNIDGLGFAILRRKTDGPVSFFLKECLQGFKKTIKLQLNANAGYLS